MPEKNLPFQYILKTLFTKLEGVQSYMQRACITIQVQVGPIKLAEF